MNVIVITVDSLRQDHVGFYHQGRAPFPAVPACRTPNIDAWAQRSIAFTNAYPSNLPTIPIRWELMTGHFGLPTRRWEPMGPHDVSMADILRRHGYVCGLITDTYHYRAPGMNYHRSFHAYEWIRGQEYDPWVSAPPTRPVDAYVNDRYPELWRRRVAQFLANTERFRSPEDGFAAQVVEKAVQWLRENRGHRKVFLWVDSFDPHEPWDPPPAFDRYRPAGYDGPRLILPMGGRALDWATPEQVDQIRGLYAGEVSFVDHCLGKLFDALEELGYTKDSLILFLADHGHPLADHGKFLKGATKLYSELLKVPFLVRLPGQEEGRVTDALIAYPDVLPTVLDVLGLAKEATTMAGRSFRPVLEGQASAHRDAVVMGYHEAGDRCIRDHRWSYILRPGDQPDELYDLQNDPRETENLVDRHPEVAAELVGRVSSLFFREDRGEIKGLQGRYEMASGAIA